MLHIKKYENFNELNEGVKEWVAAALMLFSTPSFSTEVAAPKNSRVKISDKQYKSTVNKTYIESDSVTQREIKELIRKGWNKDSQVIDTIWTETARTNPDTSVMVLRARIKGTSSFKLGVYGVQTETIEYLTTLLKSIIDTNGLISKIEIISSTDKTPLSPNLKKSLSAAGYEPNNSGLSKARAESVKRILTDGVILDGVKTPINGDLIQISNIVEAGNVDDADHRYVMVNIKYIIPTPNSVGSDKEMSLKTTVKLSKVFNYEFEKPRVKKIGNVRTHKRLDECPGR
jgi:hypothetical protein